MTFAQPQHFETDPHGAEAPQPDWTEPLHTRLDQLCGSLRDELDPYLSGQTTQPIHSPRRDALLAEARAMFDRQLRHDLDFTIHDLSTFAATVTKKIGYDVRRVPVIADLFHRLEDSRRFLRVTDATSSSKVEEQCWLATQQFYYDALELADRLIHVDGGRSIRRWPRPNAYGELPRHNLLGVTAYSWRRVIHRGFENCVPNFLSTRFFATMFPTLWQVAYHTLVPFGDATFSEFENSTLGWLGRDGLAKLRGDGSPDDVIIRGRERITENRALFDARTSRFRANVVFCGSHRIGFLDLPLFTKLLEGVPRAIWVNNSFYGPGMARKLSRDPGTICVRGDGKQRVFDAIDDTIDAMTRYGMGLFIMADGSQPNMMYGNQIRMKRGLRLLVDESARRRESTGRSTFVIPLSFDDPLSYVLGMDPKIEITTHHPIEIVKPTSDQPRTSNFDNNAINGGDDLLNQLEALFMCHSMVARHGMRTPTVLKTAHAHNRAADASPRVGDVREFIHRRGPTTLYDLSRRAGADD